MAICRPTLSAVAVTLANVLGWRGSQVTTAHTLNVRTLPESTGVVAAGPAGAAGAARRSGVAPRASSRSVRRRPRSKRSAAGTRAAAAPPGAGGGGEGIALQAIRLGVVGRGARRLGQEKVADRRGRGVGGKHGAPRRLGRS